MRFHIIGPFSAELKKLRGNGTSGLKIQVAAAHNQDAGQGRRGQVRYPELDDILLPKLAQADLLSELLPLDEIVASSKLGERAKVTTPTCLVDVLRRGKRKDAAAHGDGHHEDILRGLQHIKKLKSTAGIHVNVLKVQHHGSEHNIDEAFCRMVTADHYVFCSNGNMKS